MELIEVYIREVTRRLPEKMRDDITLELRSTIHDMLPENFSEDDVKQQLEKLGNPVVLASRYKDRPMHVIGPKFYDLYMTIFKIIFPIVAIVSLITLFAVELSTILESEKTLIIIIPTMLGRAIWTLLESFIHVFFWVTIIFAILDRTMGISDYEPLSVTGKRWMPDDLKRISYIPIKKEITKGEVIFSFCWTVLWIVLYFNAASIIGIYEINNNGLKFIVPVFNQKILMTYLAIVIVYSMLEMSRTIFMAIKRQWTLKIAIYNTVVHLISFAIIVIIARHSDLINSEFTLHFANLIDSPLNTVTMTFYWIKWGVVSLIIVTGLISIYSGFRKARI